MAHLMVPAHPSLPIYFNVDGVVGAAPAQNRREDVMLVQFFFNLIGKAVIEPDVKLLYGAVKVTGTIDATTLEAIKHLQTRHKQNYSGAIVDGRISPAKGGYSYGGGEWTIVRLNVNVRNAQHLNWPRIDKIPGCPVELKAMVMRLLVGI